MPRDIIPLTNFSAGELSGRLFGRVDLSRYFNGAALLRNFITMVEGGVTRRSGTIFAAEVRDSSKRTRIYRFEFSTVQAYILEFSNLYLRFFKNHGQVEVAGTPYEIVTPWSEVMLPDLKFTQSADVLYVCHPQVRPKQLNRLGDSNWTITDYDFQDGPYLEVNETDTTLTISGTSGSVSVTASSATGINSDTGFQATDVGRLIRWKDGAGNWTWLGITAFTDTLHVTATIRGANASATTATKQWRLGAWSDTTGWPFCAQFAENRLCFGGCTNQPANVWGSRSGNFTSHAPSDPNGTVASDHAFNIFVGDNRVNAIRWMDSGKELLVGTQGAEFSLSGGSNAMSPTNIMPKRQTTVGSHSRVGPQRVSHSLLFLNRVGRRVLEMVYDFGLDGYKAPDVSVLAKHLGTGGFVAMDFAQEPNSTLWLARADGLLVGLTFEKEQEVIAWHGHPIGGDGIVEDVAVIPDPTGSYNELWLIVRRTIDGVSKRYVEYMDAIFDDNDMLLENAVFIDSTLKYNGLSPNGLTITGSNVLHGEIICVADAAQFSTEDVGKQIRQYTGVGRARITAFTNDTEVTAVVDTPFDDLTLDIGTWGIGVKVIGGLGHLEGKDVAILGDGSVHPIRTVTDASINLDRFILKASVGLAYTSKIVTMPLESKQAVISGKIKRIVRSMIRFMATLGGKYGPSGSPNLEKLIYRTSNNPMGKATPLFTGQKEVNYPSGWERDVQAEIEINDPLPMTLLMLQHDTSITN